MLNKRLIEVDIIRPLIIFLLLVLHSVTIFNGAWNVDCENVPLYSWICNLIGGFRIETIALIAGYVFAYQSMVLDRKYPFKDFVIKKAKRLLIPMILFGIVYYFIFLFDSSTFTVSSFIIELLSGCGHLWFLPMLFWCFLGIWFIDKYRLINWWLFLLLVGFSIMPRPSLPFGLARLPHFLFYVYGGYALFIYKDKILNKFGTFYWIITFWIVYVFFVFFVNLYKPLISYDCSFIGKLFRLVMVYSLELLESCSGILALYLLVCRMIMKNNYIESSFILSASKLCYGVYVYHQFILMYLYTIYDLPHRINIYLVPWIGLTITLIGSLLLTILTLKTRWGRYLIG